MRFVSIAILAFLTCAECLIIPEEIPSFLSLVYSSIPPIKKGTDSRLGLGFRLGPYADLQILLELGPQTKTDPLGPSSDKTVKRETLVMRNPQNLWEYFNGLKNSYDPEEKKKVNDRLSDSPGGKWMDWWRKNVLAKKEIGKIQFKKVPGIDDRNSMDSDDDETMPNGVQSSIADHLGQLYRG